MKYLILTYSNDGELVLDNTMGVGTTCFKMSLIYPLPSGFSEVDRRIIGFNKGEITFFGVVKNGSAKSTIINQLSLNAVEHHPKKASL